MHDLVNDLAKSESREFCLQVEGDKVQEISERTRHVWSSLNLKDDVRILKHIYRIKGLQSLLVERVGDGGQCFRISKNVQCDLFSKLKYLQMLSFCGGWGDILYGELYNLELADEIGNLKLLRYLNLSWTGIKRLPDSICKLYNLETLILKGCYKFVEFPLDFYKLDRLRHLNLNETAIKKMPKKIRRLNHLQTLTDFVVGEPSGSDIEELHSLNLLQGKLRLSGLENVINPVHAVEANLQDKKYLEEIHMIGIKENSYVETAVSVLDALQPNSNVKRLTIENYNGNMFPNWLMGCDLSNLVSLTLEYCGLCSHLPSLGQIPSLKELYISRCEGIKIIDKEFYGNNSTNVPFKSLEVLVLSSMYNWEEWLYIEGFPLLKELSLEYCPKLKRVLLPDLPSLQKLKIFCCKMLDVSIPKGDNILYLNIRICDRILINELSSVLKKLVLCGNQYIEFSADHLINCPFLEVLKLDFMEFVECPSFDLCCYNSLCKLSITGWKLSSLPFSLHLFTNLRFLNVSNCPNLESFPMGGLPSNLSRLTICNCPKLIASREQWGLFQLNSLNSFTFSGHDFENVESFPEENLLPPTLKVLHLENWSKLISMNYKGFLHLKSLLYISIRNCPSLESLPEEGLPNSLKSLEIYNCLLVREKYKKEGGERWHTISHIPYVEIDNIRQRRNYQT